MKVGKKRGEDVRRVEEHRIAIVWLMAVRLLEDIVFTLTVADEIDGFAVRHVVGVDRRPSKGGVMFGAGGPSRTRFDSEEVLEKRERIRLLALFRLHFGSSYGYS